jgi:hypothetical protein
MVVVINLGTAGHPTGLADEISSVFNRMSAIRQLGGTQAVGVPAAMVQVKQKPSVLAEHGRAA